MKTLTHVHEDREPVLSVDTAKGQIARPRNGIATYVVLITRGEDEAEYEGDAEAGIAQVVAELQDACDIAGLCTWFQVMGRLADGEYTEVQPA